VRTPSPVGEAGRILSANNENLRIFYTYFGASLDEVKIVLPVVVAQHKGKEKIGEARKRFRRSLLIGPKIAI
jgi:hypothetical protein